MKTKLTILLLLLLLCSPAYAQKTLKEIGCKPNDPAAGDQNSKLLNAYLLKNRGGSILAPAGDWWWSAPIMGGRG